MEDNWSLSDKINTVPGLDGGEDIELDIDIEDVKEFIRLLHNEFHIAKDIETTTAQQIITLDWVDRIIDKLAGSKLL